MAIAERESLSVTARGDREIQMVRVFKAPRRLVWDASTKPKLFVRWFGSRGWTVSTCEMDVRPGGAYRYVLRRDDGGQEMVMRGEYREVVPPERLVTTEAWEGFIEPGWRPEDATVTTTILTERDAKTTWTATMLYPSQAVRDAALHLKPAWKGAGEGFARLAELLEKLTLSNVVITRRFDAPIEEVWRAWSEPKRVMKWWGPVGFTSPSAEMEFREGGRSLVCMRASPEYGGQDWYNTWTYSKIVPLERIEFRSRFTDKDGNELDPAKMGLPPGVPQEVPHVITFRSMGGDGTEMTVTEYGYTTEQARAISQTGMEQCLDKMAASLARGKHDDDK